MATVFKRSDRRNYRIAYFDASGKRRERSSRTTDYRTAERIAAKLEADVALRRDNVVDARADRAIIEGRKALSMQIDDYETYLKSKGVSERHRKQTRKRLETIISGCGYCNLNDITCTPIEQRLNILADGDIGPRTRNTYIASAKAFTSWCVKTGRLSADPLATLKRANEAEDIRRKRRALTADELARLLVVAELRPTAEYGRESRPKNTNERKSKRDTWIKAPLTWDTLQAAVGRAQDVLRLKPLFLSRLERIGRERRLIYSTLITTGLRVGELRQLRWSALELDGVQPTLTVEASTSKSGKTDTLPLRSDLAEFLRQWRAVCGEPEPNTPVFHVSKDLLRAFYADLAVAEIDKTDSAGRQVDLHAIRHSTATHLAKAGVAPRAAQAILRHSKIDLTMRVYTDPRLLDLAGAVDALPGLGAGSIEREQQRATGSLGAVGNVEIPCQQKRQQSERFSQRFPATLCEIGGSKRGGVSIPNSSKLAGKYGGLRPVATTSENSGRRDSNAQRSAWKADALPLSYAREGMPSCRVASE